jgi:RNA polymerase sigma factor (sigma-70 family)
MRDPRLDAVIASETFREVLDTLTARQFVVVALRFDGLTDDQIAQSLHISEHAVRERLRRARLRILRRIPELADVLDSIYAGEGPGWSHCP